VAGSIAFVGRGSVPDFQQGREAPLGRSTLGTGRYESRFARRDAPLAELLGGVC